jgi:hypothetical protein
MALPKGISKTRPGAAISDGGSVFVSLFWATIWNLIQRDCIATTAYNPRSDGQSERTNQVVEIALYHLVNEHQHNWVDHLSEIQFGMNNALRELLIAFTLRSAVDIPTGHIQLHGQASQATSRAHAIR